MAKDELITNTPLSTRANRALVQNDVSTVLLYWGNIGGLQMTAEKIVQIVVAAYQARELKTVLELMADDIVFTNTAEPGIAPHCANVSSKEEFVAYLTEIDESWEIDQFQITQLIASGDEVATRSLMDYVSKKTQKRVVTQGAHFWTISDGKVIKIHEFYDTAAVGACK